MNSSKAFTIIELVFVIVVLGILAAVALPRFGQTRELADIAKGRADVATIRAAIVNERQTRLILGDAAYITTADLDTAAGLFGGVLTYPITNSDTSGNWNTVTPGDGSYNYNVSGTNTAFTYTPGTGVFTCVAGANDCDRLVD